PLVSIPDIIQLPIEDQHPCNEYQRNDKLKCQQRVAEPSRTVAGLETAFQNRYRMIAGKKHSGIAARYQRGKGRRYQQLPSDLTVHGKSGKIISQPFL